MSADDTQGDGDRVAAFTAFRQRMNERILAEPNQVVRRFFALDTREATRPSSSLVFTSRAPA